MGELKDQKNRNIFRKGVLYEEESVKGEIRKRGRGDGGYDS
jgi:hypothetical protein